MKNPKKSKRKQLMEEKKEKQNDFRSCYFGCVPSNEQEFETAFREASNIIAIMAGFLRISYSIVWKNKIDICYLSNGKLWKFIRLDSAGHRNIRNGKNACITFTIHFQLWNITS